MSDDKIPVLPVKHKAELRHLTLVPPERAGCLHYPAQFTVDVNAAKCFCRKCNAEVSPMFVLERLMNQESQWNRTRESYQDEMRRLAERSRTKCQHCGKQTRISHR